VQKKVGTTSLLYYQYFLPYNITDYPVDDHSPAVLDPASSNTGGQRGKVLSPRHLANPEGRRVPTWTEHAYYLFIYLLFIYLFMYLFIYFFSYLFIYLFIYCITK